MADIDKAIVTQLANIEKRTGRKLEELAAIVRSSGLAKHGEIRDMLKRELGMGHGDANTLTHYAMRTAGPGCPGQGEASAEDVAAGIYSGAKAPLRPVHDALMAEIAKFGPFEIAPKKGYLSLRRKKQFAMVGPATNTRVEVGLNMKGVAGTERLLEQPAGGMCSHKVKLTSESEVDRELLGWIKKAYDGAG